MNSNTLLYIMDHLLETLTCQRIKMNLCGSSNHAAYLVKSGKKRYCFKQPTELWRESL